MKILFVCTGNTCRSPIAEGLFKEILRKENKTDTQTASAGIAAAAGSPPSQNAVTAMKEKGIDISAHRAVQLTEQMIKDADTVLVMTEQQYKMLTAIYPDAHNIGLISLKEIPDPYGQPLAAYRECVETLQAALEIIAEQL